MLGKVSALTGEIAFFPTNSQQNSVNSVVKRISESDRTTISGLSEIDLIEQINQGLPLEVWEKYAVLLATRRAEQLNGKDHETLLTITNRIESFNGRRLNLLFELAKLQNRKVLELMQNYAGENHSLVEKQLSADQRKEIISRAEGVCEYCCVLSVYSFTPFSFEMIRPQIRGGRVTTENLVYCCQGCANYKYLETRSFDFITGCPTDFFNPRKDVWKENFRWSVDFTQLIGLTAKGRATLAKIRLNRAGLVNFRQILVRNGICAFLPN